jgi:hypothetical protein
MKKFLLGLLSIVLLFASFWGVNGRGQRSRPGRGSDQSLWV